MLGLAASLFLLTVAPARAKTPDAQIAEAQRLFFEGQGLKARTQLAALAEAERGDPASRALALQTLLEICRRMRAAECLVANTQAYVDAVSASVSSDPIRRAQQALEVGYYINADRLAIGSGPALAQAMADPMWGVDIPGEGLIYLRRRALRADILLASGKPEEAEQAISEVLAIAGAIRSPAAASYDIATVLADALATLVELGAYERAYGLFVASAGFVVAALPPRTPEAVLFQRTAANLLLGVDDGLGAARATDAVLDSLADLELDAETRAWLSGSALNMKAGLCKDGPDCSVRALSDHPLGALYRTPGRAPANVAEVRYLGARGLAAQRAGRPDAVAAAALGGPLGFKPQAEERAAVEAFRTMSRGFGLPAGPEKSQAIGELGAQVQAAAAAAGALPGSWFRPGVFDRLMVGIALIPATREATDPETTFALIQLAGRAGPGFDADAMTLLSSARTADQRRAAHQGLRLRAQRDRLEQASIAEMVGRARAPASGGSFDYDAARLAELAGLNERLAVSDASLVRAGLAMSGSNLVSLQRLRGVLAKDEAALAYVPVGGGRAYACVRRDGMTVVAAPSDKDHPLDLDVRLLQAALSATHAPDEDADGQFPVAAAVRLYDAFLRPFEPCLKPNDRVIWLSPLISVGGLPLGALLSRAPPRRGAGYDLAAADWFVRSHAVSYAGSAAALVAARSARLSPPVREFLGVGDPVLDRPGAEAVRKAGLGPLPETAAELAQSARPFRTAQVLTGEAATEAQVRAALVRGARLVSFATHGVMRGEVEGVSEPALVLTPAAGPASDDGFLTASEIADLELPADFVALSACNTANLEFTRIAQDLPALSSAFAQAGARATLGTLWPVNSETSATVVAGVFARLADAGGTGAAEALAQAQRAYLAAPPDRARLHPRFWAPFIILGDGGVRGR